jgi:hypothetical protein
MFESANPEHRFPAGAGVARVASGVFHARCDLYWNRGVGASAHDDSTRRGLAVP